MMMIVCIYICIHIYIQIVCGCMWLHMDIYGYGYVSGDPFIPNGDIWRIYADSHGDMKKYYPLVICYMAIEAMAHRNS